MKAGKLAFGTEAVIESLEKRKAKMVLMANDCSDRTQKKFQEITEKHQIPLFTIGTTEEISKAIGKDKKSVVSIKDSNNNVITDTSHIGYINPFRYRSYYYDNETKLYYLNSRYYNPEWGRFTNEDNIFEQNDSLFGNNLYIYCLNNPLSFLDTNGQSIANVWDLDDKVYEYDYTVVCTKDNGYYKVFIKIEGLDFTADIDGNAIRFNFEANSNYSEKYAYTLATVTYNAYNLVYGEEMEGRTIEGLTMELKLHDTLYSVTGIDNFKTADMGTTKNDNNAWVSEFFKTKNISLQKNKSVKKESKKKKKKTYIKIIDFIRNLILIM